jgi:hypothetical protein
MLVSFFLVYLHPIHHHLGSVYDISYFRISEKGKASIIPAFLRIKKSNLIYENETWIS